MDERNKVEVKIGGKEYTLVGIESDEYIHKVATYIDKKMTEIMHSNNRLSTALVAVLAAVNVADDYFKAHDSELDMDKEIKKISDDNERLKAENRRLTRENEEFSQTNTDLKLENAKLEAEIKEIKKYY